VVHLGHPKWTKRLAKEDHLGDVQGVEAGAHLLVSRRTGRASLPDEVGSSPPKILGRRRRTGIMNERNLLPVRLGSDRR
jgi:hypothetical protein